MKQTVTNSYGKSFEIELGEAPGVAEKIPESEFKGGYSKTHAPVSIPICESHTKEDWLTHRGYVDNHDGTISCRFCPWGTPLAGYYKCFEGKIVDLRTLNRA